MADAILYLELDEADVRGWYDEHVADVEWYRDNGKLDPDHPDVGYRTGQPESYESYRAGMLASVLEDVAGEFTGYRVTVRASKENERG